MLSDSTPFRTIVGQRTAALSTAIGGSATSISQRAPKTDKSDVLPFPTPANEPQRLAALRALAILDSPSEAAYDEIAVLAAQICQCPIGCISFIDDNRRWLKAARARPRCWSQ